MGACQLGASPPDNTGPVRAVEEFVTALEARDPSAMIDLLEPTDWRKEVGPELRAYLSYVKTLDLHDEQYSVLENDGTMALVRLTGTLTYALEEGTTSGERAVDLQVETVRVDDRWYLRSLALPQP